MKKKLGEKEGIIPGTAFPASRTLPVWGSVPNAPLSYSNTNTIKIRKRRTGSGKQEYCKSSPFILDIPSPTPKFSHLVLI